MLHLKVLFARRPHARIKRLDTRQAEAYPGVVAVFTAKDVPVNEYGLILNDQPVLCGDIVRFVGDKVALVVAETEQAAEYARNLIEVEYVDLPVVSDPFEAMQPDAPLVHVENGTNVLKHYVIRKGDIQAGFAQADVIVEGTFSTGFQEHAYLQPEAGLGYIDEAGRVTVEVAGQWVHEDRKQIAHALALPEDRVRVKYVYTGGAFGGREDMSVQIILALAAWKLGRPVKTVWTREESIIGHHKRHPMHFHHRWGATREGKIVAAQVETVADGGAYASTSPKVLGNVNLMCIGPYEIPHVHADTIVVYTNNIPTGAFRGFGAPQAHFAAELMIERLAEALGMDPVELRLRNCLRDGSTLATQLEVPAGVSLAQVLERCAQEAGWPMTPPLPDRERGLGGEGRLRGKGIACAFKNVGFSFGFPEESWATVELQGEAEIENVIVRHAGAEVGQGAHTAMCQIAASALGVPVEKIRLIAADTGETHNSGSASASRMTFMAGNAIRGAAEQALAMWKNEDRPAIATFRYCPPATSPLDPKTGKAHPNFAYGYVAQAVELEVDVETGQIHVLKVISVDDVGKAVNPQQIEGQIEGAVAQAFGWAVTENFVMQAGQVLTPYFNTYLIPGVLDVPDVVQSVLLEHPDPVGPFGIRGVGEMPFLPFAPALVAALHDATGVWFDSIPLTPERVLAGLKNVKRAMSGQPHDFQSPPGSH